MPDDAPPDSPAPFVTIIVPIRNEAHYIAGSLRSVLAQDYPADRMEILVVDGMSDDGTRAIVQRIIDDRREAIGDDRPAILLLDNPARTVPPALNAGLHHARGEVIIRVDGHCVIAANYVRCCVAALRETEADCVGGPMLTIGKTYIAHVIAQAQSSRFGVGGVAFRTGRAQPGYVDTVAFGAYRRAVFERIGGFDEELVRNQDDELNFRLTQAGGRIWLDPSIRSAYYSRAGFHSLWHQYFQYGLYKVRVIQKRGAVPSWRHLVPATFVLSLMGSMILAAITRKPGVVLSVAGPYAVANGLAGLLIARREWRMLPLLSFAFLVLHLAYGAGFLWGIGYWSRVPLKPTVKKPCG